MEKNKNIALIGMPAVGKSTVGVLLAKKMGYGFIDTDILIQTGEQMSLSQIIGQKGQKAFLDTEADYLMGLDCTGHVIATGGSVIYRKEAMAHLAKIATIVYLSVDLDILVTRLFDVVARGVAIDPGQDIGGLYKERAPLYDAHCHVKVNCRNKGAAQVAAAVSEGILKFAGEDHG